MANITMIYGKSLVIVLVAVYPNERLDYLEITALPRPFCF